MNYDEAKSILAELKELDAKDEKRLADLKRADEILDTVTKARREQDRKGLQRQLESLGTVSHTAGGPEPGLGAALESAGFHRTNRPSVTVDVKAALGVETKAGSVDGNLEDALGQQFPSPALGIDGRYLFPNVAQRFVASDVAGVTSFRQKSRSLASPSSMVRAIAATSEKPESGTVAEPVSEPLRQIASKQKNTPNILLESDNFRRWVDADLTAAWRAALDYHIVSELALEVTAAASGGTGIYEKILYAAEEVRSAGYDPNVVALSPTDALSLQLLQLSSGVTYVFEQVPPRVVVSPVISNGSGIVFDAAAIGELYLSPFRIAVFEESSGQTNASTVRGESNGLFLVQRADAACFLDEQGS